MLLNQIWWNIISIRCPANTRIDSVWDQKHEVALVGFKTRYHFSCSSSSKIHNVWYSVLHSLCPRLDFSLFGYATDNAKVEHNKQGEAYPRRNMFESCLAWGKLQTQCTSLEKERQWKWKRKVSRLVENSWLYVYHPSSLPCLSYKTPHPSFAASIFPTRLDLNVAVHWWSVRYIPPYYFFGAFVIRS